MTHTVDYALLNMEDEQAVHATHQEDKHIQQVGSHMEKELTQDWANGLRGLAALLVTFHHLVVAFNTHATLNTSDADGTVHFWQWPIIRAFTSPNFMVTIFFVLSAGYVLSYRPLHRLEQSPLAAVSVRDSLASACLRRIFRLLPPAAMSIFLSHVILLAGGFDRARSGKVGDWWVAQCTPRWVSKSWLGQTIEALRTVVLIWHQKMIFSRYNVVLWTMPEELQGSLRVYLFLLATSKLQRKFRTMLAIGLALVQLITKETSTLQFIMGLLIAELQVAQSNQLNEGTTRECTWARSFLNFFALLIALMCGSVPYLEMKKAGWSKRMYLILAKVYSSEEEEVKSLYLVIGGVLMILTISQWPTVREIFSTQPLQFLGKISFSLYVIHVPLLLSFGMWLPIQLRQLGVSETFSIVLMAPCWYGLALALSWLMTKFVDERSVYISHQLEVVWGVQSSNPVEATSETEGNSSAN
ncbi:hypothetical protein CROQUDRAFT_53768 [Cronartium quercuum f. sp. fusiforme G11]|uniref:Acyltransferase 3 domain-containing protein n=1 Tax=Cronartium quercuum f. sp. fusiforme G11 TaxID=708437 RepID=A0A9P6N6Z9_9BASI|nr:hypothetical protein CROQUDRAFT_53768 [Cronartium quercuum f. sp. fusiforme G11]